MDHIELVTKKEVGELEKIIGETVEQFSGQTSLEDVTLDGVSRLVVWINNKLRSVQ